MPSAAPAASGLMGDPLLASVPVRDGCGVLGGVVPYARLGRGGMGAVHRGRRLRLDLDVAVKVMLPRPGAAPGEGQERDGNGGHGGHGEHDGTGEHGAHDEHVERFLREARLAAPISHQILVRVIDVNAEHGLHYLVMDYVDGESAGERLKRRGRLSEAEAVEIVLGAAEGLTPAHRAGVTHRDAKPDNVLIDKLGRVRVVDLGLAKALALGGDPDAPSKLTATGVMLGAPYYLPPEQFSSPQDVGPASDVWALGVTLYELVTGATPWQADSLFALLKAVAETPLPLGKAGLSDGLAAVVGKPCAKAAIDRRWDPAELAEALRPCLAAARPSQKSVPPDEYAGTGRRTVYSAPPPSSATLTLIGRCLLDGPAPTSALVASPVHARRLQEDEVQDVELDDDTAEVILGTQDV